MMLGSGMSKGREEQKKKKTAKESIFKPFKSPKPMPESLKRSLPQALTVQTEQKAENQRQTNLQAFITSHSASLLFFQCGRKYSVLKEAAQEKGRQTDPKAGKGPKETNI